MNKVFELSYEQNYRRGNQVHTTTMVAGYTQSEAEAKAFAAADDRNQIKEIELSDDEMWQVE